MAKIQLPGDPGKEKEPVERFILFLLRFAVFPFYLVEG